MSNNLNTKKQEFIVSVEGGLGAQIISLSVYYYLKELEYKVLLDLSYFDNTPHVALEGDKKLSYWPWELDNYGINKGSNGDLVVLQCKDPIEAIRLKPARLFVVRHGKVISSTDPVNYELNLGSNTESEDLLFKG